MPGIIPGQNERSKTTTGVTESVFVAFFPNIGANVSLLVRDVTRWVNENRSELRIVIRPAMQKKKACLNCDRDPDLVGQLKTTASFEMFFCEKDLNMTEQFDLICTRKSSKGWKVANNDRPPGHGKWFRPQLLASSFL